MNIKGVRFKRESYQIFMLVSIEVSHPLLLPMLDYVLPLSFGKDHPKIVDAAAIELRQSGRFQTNGPMAFFSRKPKEQIFRNKLLRILQHPTPVDLSSPANKTPRHVDVIVHGLTGVKAGFPSLAILSVCLDSPKAAIDSRRSVACRTILFLFDIILPPIFFSVLSRCWTHC